MQQANCTKTLTSKQLPGQGHKLHIIKLKLAEIPLSGIGQLLLLRSRTKLLVWPRQPHLLPQMLTLEVARLMALSLQSKTALLKPQLTILKDTEIKL